MSMSLPALNCKNWMANLRGNGTGDLADIEGKRIAACRWDPDAAPVKDAYKSKAIMYGTVGGGWRARVLEGEKRALLFREGKYAGECSVSWPLEGLLATSELPAHYVG